MRYKAGILLTMVIFGTTGLVRRWLPVSSSMISFVRSLVGVLFLGAVMACRRKKPNWAALRKNALRLCLSGALLGLGWVVLFEAYEYAPMSTVTVCYYMAPVFVVLLSPLVGERLTPMRLVCCLAAFVGMGLVCGVWQGAFTGVKGILLALLSAGMYAAITLVNKGVRGLRPMESTAAQLAVSALATFAYLLCTQGAALPRLDGRSAALLLVMGALHTGVAYTLYFGGLEHVPAQTVALMSYLDPIVALALSVLVLGERLSALSALGVALVLFSTAISETGPGIAAFFSKSCKKREG